MDDLRPLRSLLETLSTSDLLAKADALGVDIPPDLTRNFVIQEILESECELANSLAGEEPILSETREERPTAELPRGYNETIVAVIPRDPLWAYVFWEIRQSDKDNREKSPAFGGYRLQVVNLHGPNGKRDGTGFLVSVEKTDNAWYLCLPPDTGWCQVDLCGLVNGTLEIIASSAAFHIPGGKLRLAAVGDALPEAVRLSGVADLRVSKNIDRSSHRPQRCEA